MRIPTDRTAYRSAIGIAILASFLLIWLSLGVGINGFFIALFAGSAWLFRRAALGLRRPERGDA